MDTKQQIVHNRTTTTTIVVMATTAREKKQGAAIIATRKAMLKLIVGAIPKARIENQKNVVLLLTPMIELLSFC